MPPQSDPFSGVGTAFKRGDGASSETFTAIAQINSYDGPSMSRDTIDTTSMDTTGGYRTFIGGFRDGGELSFDMNFTLDGYDDLKTDFESDDLRNYQLVLPDSNETTFSFAALVSNLGMAIPNDDKVTASVTLKISGQVSLSS